MSHPEEIPANADETVDERDMLAEILACCGCCLVYCSDTNVWPHFRDWLISKGLMTEQQMESQEIDRQFLIEASYMLKKLITQVETELIAAKFEEYLGKIDDK
jgi:hypothetical protein